MSDILHDDPRDGRQSLNPKNAAMHSAFSPGTESLKLRNGCSAPLDAIPCFSFSYFRHWLLSLLRAGSRVAAFFAVPLDDEGMPKARDLTVEAVPGPFRIFAVLADEQSGFLHIASTEAEDRYPSLTLAAPELHLFEREIHEKFGIVPDNHPWLKPVRFEKISGPEVGNMEFFRVNGDEVHEVAVGPIHAGVIECGHFRFQCLGEEVLHLEVSLGYHHRGIERQIINGPFTNTLPLMEVLAGDSTIAHSWAYCSLLESLADLPVSPRGQIVRSIALELERLANHTGDLGAIAGDVGFLSTLSYCGRLRGDWLNMSAMLCGSRFGRRLLTPGGVCFDVEKRLADDLNLKLRQTGRDVQGALALMWHSPSVMARLTGIGILPKKTAQELGVVGVAARASGLERDVRHSHPLSGVPQPPPLVVAAQGDVRARAYVRHQEVTVSTAFCRRLLENVFDSDDDGEGFLIHNQTPELKPEHIAVAMVEGWRGELCHVGLTDAKGRFSAYSVVDPSFHNWYGLAVALRGQQISDFPLCNKSFNLSYCGHDL